ncbi:hypothetical protein VTG60DRAFT_4645 [Thermothelomyces hinnuleus]
MLSISGAYQAVAASSHGFVAQAPITPPITAYQTVPGPTATAAHITQHQYNDPRMYYPAGTAYTTGVPCYAGFVHMTGSGCGHLSAMAYEWPLVPTPSPPQGDMTASHINNNSNNNSSNGGRPAVFVEKRKILIRGLERNGLSPAVVTDLLVQNAGIGATPGQVEKVELPLNKDGKARGIAYITFSTEELAGAAVTALEGCKAVGSRKLSARLVVEGVSPEGSDDGAPRPCQRLAGGGGSRGGGRAGSSSKRGAGGKAPKSSLQEQSPRTSTETLLVQLKSDTAASALPSAASDGQRKKEERPVIVDGSGGRWKKEPAPVVVGGTANK